MQEINLRDYYPELYTEDYFETVSDEVAEMMLEDRRREYAALRRKYWHSAHYSLDRGDGIEFSALNKPVPPWLSYERKVFDMELYNALLQLPDKQLQRLYAYYFLKKGIVEIAKAEGVHHSTITKSIRRALCNLTNLVRYPF